VAEEVEVVAAEVAVAEVVVVEIMDKFPPICQQKVLVYLKLDKFLYKLDYYNLCFPHSQS
jgi:hypothetical protein